MKITIRFNNPLEDGSISLTLTCDVFSVFGDVVCVTKPDGSGEFYFDVRYVIAHV